MQAIAATLFEEGAITLIYVVLVHCKYMLERLSNSYGKSFPQFKLFGSVRKLDLRCKFYIIKKMT